jgi:hypothetical protein
MSAEIIQFGKRERRMPDAILPRRARAGRRSIVQHTETSIRFVFDGELYEAHFCDENIQRICLLQYRINATGVEEMRRPRWRSGWERDGDFDLALARAAHHARKNGGNDDGSALQKALSELSKRREKLVRMVEQANRAIADLQERISTRAATFP